MLDEIFTFWSIPNWEETDVVGALKKTKKIYTLISKIKRNCFLISYSFWHQNFILFCFSEYCLYQSPQNALFTFRNILLFETGLLQHEKNCVSIKYTAVFVFFQTIFVFKFGLKNSDFFVHIRAKYIFLFKRQLLQLFIIIDILSISEEPCRIWTFTTKGGGATMIFDFSALHNFQLT